MTKGLRDSIGRTNSLVHYKNKRVFEKATFESIDFEPVKMVLTSKPKMYNLRCCKLCSGLWGTEKMLKIRGRRTADAPTTTGYRKMRCP